MEHTDLSRLDLPEERTKLNREQGGYSFYAYLSRMRYISRWGLMRNSCPENIQEHSHMVAVLALCTGAHLPGYLRQHLHFPGDLCHVALFHDAPEIITGDTPTPVKYYSPEIRQAYQKVEDVAVEQLLSMLPPALRDSYTPLLRDVPPEVEKSSRRRISSRPISSAARSSRHPTTNLFWRAADPAGAGRYEYAGSTLFH